MPDNHHGFADNVRDLSTPNGYQFEFVCERCGNRYLSPFVRDKIDFGRVLARALGGLIGTSSPQLAHVGAWVEGPGGPVVEPGPAARNRAVERAAETVREVFRQCRGCGDRVCDDVCWHESGQCVSCARSASVAG